MSSIGEIAKFRSSIQVDTINEFTSASGVTIDSMLIKYGKTSSNNIDWQEPTMFRNRIINGGFPINQRGASITSISADYTYTADRWYVRRGGNLDYALRAVGSYNPPAGFYNYGEFVNKTAANPFIAVEQPIETSNCYDLAGKSVTLSFWARAAANTAVSKELIVGYYWNTAVDTKTGSFVVITTASLNYGTAATDWTQYSYTFTVPATAKTVGPSFSQSTLAVNDGFHITGVQLEPGSIATPFEFRPYGTELALCQRYYWPFDVQMPTTSGGFAPNAYLTIMAPISFRITATPTITSSVLYTVGGAGSAYDSYTMSAVQNTNFVRGSFSGAAWSTTANGALLIVVGNVNCEL